MNRSGIRKSNAGTVMVMAVFYGIFLVAIVFHVASVGGAALEQEVTQNAADATVFSAATANARGMNTIAFVNRFMAFAVAVLIGIRLLEVVMLAVIAICSVLCGVPFFGGAGCGALAAARPVYTEVRQIATQVEKVVTRLNTALTRANEKGFKPLVPYLAEAEAIYISTDEIYDPVTAGFVWPLLDGLPVEAGRFEDLCAEGAASVADVVGFFAVGIPDSILERALGGLVTSFSSYFCGQSGSGVSPPSETRMEEVAYPTFLDEDERCSGDAGGGCARRGVAMCDSEANWPQRHTGRCAENNPGCKRCAQRSCNKCLPLLETDSYRRGSWYVYRENFVRAEGVDGLNYQFETRGEEFLDEERAGNPCKRASGGARANCGGYAGDWNSLSSVCSLKKELGDVSHSELLRLAAQYGVELKSAQRVRMDHYTAVIGCVVEKDMILSAQGEPLTENPANSRIYPMVIDSDRYPDDARMRGVVVGGAAASRRLSTVGFSSKKQARGAPGRVGLASAFYYSTEENPERALWSMKWTTRLVRFRLPSGDGASRSEGSGLPFGQCDDRFFGACSDVSSAARQRFEGLGGLELMVH